MRGRILKWIVDRTLDGANLNETNSPARSMCVAVVQLLTSSPPP